MCRKRRSTFISLTAVAVYSQKQKQRLVSKLPDRCFCFDFAWLVTLNLLVFILILRIEICEGGAVRQLPEHPGVDPHEKRNGYRG